MEKTPNLKRKAFLLVGMSFEIGVLLALVVWLGQKADRHFNTGNALTAALIIGALLIWFYQLIRLFGKSK